MVVYLVGAGPGDPELITLKAHRLLRNADAILYDQLVHPNLVTLAKPGCKTYFVGKKSGLHYKTQNETNKLLVELGSKLDVVVRLKGGDPFLFGRGGEEAEVLVNSEVPFEIVPGVSSVSAVPTYAGIPITHREFNSGFAVFTGHSAAMNTSVELDKTPPLVVILMGVSNRQDIAQRLLKSDHFTPLTPVAIVSWGTYLKQKVVVTTIGQMESADVETPAIIIVGENVGLRERLDWFDRKLRCLREKKILIPRSRELDNEIGMTLENLGAKAIFHPLIELRRVPFETPNPDDYDAYVFTSKNGVKMFTSQTSLDSSKEYFAIGPTTQNELKMKGIHAACGSKFNSIALGETILENLPNGSKVLLIRSANATSDLKHMLNDRFDVTEMHVYEVVPTSIEKETLVNVDVILITAGSVAKPLLPFFDYLKKNKVLVVSIGPMATRAMNEMGLNPDTEASIHTLEGMIYALIDHLNQENIMN